MKKLLLLMFWLCAINLKSQYVTIPDANFVTWLQANVPTAMNGNQMDTTSLAVLTHTVINQLPSQSNPSPLPILNYYGIEYFKGLKILKLSNNYNVQSLPKFPNSIEELDLTGFPNTTSITSFPSNLKKLTLSLKITTLPTLPAGLESLVLYPKYSFVWPQLPNGLKSLTCSSSGVNAAQYLPSLPNGLKTLYCSTFSLSDLPSILPDSLETLSCSMNPLATLPPLPNNLKNLDCNWIQITTLPPLPNSLQRLSCFNNYSLTALPTLPSNLIELDCQNSALMSLPILPDSLRKFWGRNNQITSIQNIPKKLEIFAIAGSPISCIPILPNSLLYIDIRNTSLSCIPNYPPAAIFEGAQFYTVPSICIHNDSIFNPNECEVANGIIGTTYFDTNSNCHKDSLDTHLKNIVIKSVDINDNSFVKTNSYFNGIYNFVYPTGNYKVILDTTNVPYTFQCNQPGIDTIVQLTTQNPTAENIDFSVKCKPGFDIGVQSVVTSGIVFPGQTHTLKINAGDMSHWYNLNCASGVSGLLTLHISGPVSYVSPAIGALIPVISGNSYSYAISDFGTIDNLNDFSLILKTDTTANAGDSVCVSIELTPKNGDTDTLNNSYNYCYNVVNSYDPNMKEVYPINAQPGFNDWLTYTIHFQNTGNAPAFNIRLIDTLDNNLNLETFKVINYSHQNTWSINGKNLFFYFKNIQLPDSTSDSEGSKGFVQYKIKPKNNLGAGTKIKNTAYIYFDYNSPIVTNTTINEYLQVISVKELNNNNTLVIYPNPNNGTFTIELKSNEKQTLQLFDISGKLVFSQIIENGKANVDASTLSSGVYNLTVKSNNSVSNKKLVIVK